MGIINNTIEDIELMTGIVLGHLSKVQHLGREDAYALDPSEQPLCNGICHITSQVWSDPVLEEMYGELTQQVCNALFLEEPGESSKQEG